MTLRRPGRQLIDDGWDFRFEDEPTCPVYLPHTWNALDAMHPSGGAGGGWYRRGVGTYRRRLDTAPLRAGERLWLEIEAASQKAVVKAGGGVLGRHLGGYTAFTVELTEARRHSNSLELSVEVDNRPDPDLIPSDLSDFFLHGGLTRHAWLYRTGRSRISRVSPLVTLEAGGAWVRLEVHLDPPPARRTSLIAHLLSPTWAPVATASILTRGEVATLDLGRIPDPHLWSPATPALHHLSIELRGSDTVNLALGLRQFEFPPGGLPTLNRHPIQLRGTHRHEDWAGMGSAVPDHLTLRELEMVRAAGLNFIRLGHYPQSATVLDACDSLGLLVWDELPWCRGGVGGELFQERTRTMLREMVEQHGHHPSVILWGLGNELDWEQTDHPGSTEARTVEFLRELHEECHRLDPGRLTALRRFEPGAGIVDVYSPSNWSGWYRGRYQDYEAALTEMLVRGHPRMLHIEWGADSHAGRHNHGPHLETDLESGADHGERPGDALGADGPARASRDGDWSESYALDLMEWHLQVQLRSPLAGWAQWAFKDFGTPLRPENPLPYVNQKGLLDRAGRPKDVYHLFRSYLSAEPMCHIESSSWPERVVTPGRTELVRVYSNCEEVELWVGEASAGRRRRDGSAFPAAGLTWEVDLPAGSVRLRAVGCSGDGIRVEHHLEVRCHRGPAGAPERLSTWTELATSPDERPSTLVGARIVDARGVPCVTDARWVSFELEGSGELWRDRGTVDGSARVQAANGRAAIHVLGQGRVRIEADGLPAATVGLGDAAEELVLHGNV